MVDNYKLISMVKERKPLWDVKNKNYQNRKTARKLWQEIAEEMNSTGAVVKSRWQNLRDMFRRELTKRTKPIDGSAMPSPWKYYNQLLFIADMFTTKKERLNKVSSSGPAPQQVNVKIEDEEMLPVYMVDVDVSNGSAEMQEPEAISTQEDPLRVDSANLFNNQTNPMIKLETRSETEAINQFIQLEMRKMEQLERMQKLSKTTEDLEHDEDYHFLMSLLPHLRDIPKNRKLCARMRLQQVLVEEIEMAKH